MGHPGDTQGPERAALAQVQRPGSASPPQPRNRSAGGQVCFITKNLLRKQNQCCKLGTEKEQWVPRPPSHSLEPGEGLGPSSWQEPPPPDRMGLPPLGSWWGGGATFPLVPSAPPKAFSGSSSPLLLGCRNSPSRGGLWIQAPGTALKGSRGKARAKPGTRCQRRARQCSPLG